jgi:hypothetical protein
MPDDRNGRRVVAALSRQPRPLKVSVLAASLMLAALRAFAESVRVVDGDTLKIDGVTYRLWRIDALPVLPGWRLDRPTESKSVAVQQPAAARMLPGHLDRLRHSGLP